MTPEPDYIREIPDLPLPTLTAAQRYYRRCRKQAGYQKNYRARMKAVGRLERDELAVVTFNLLIDSWARNPDAFPGLPRAVLQACEEAGAPREVTRKQLAGMIARRLRQIDATVAAKA